MTIMRGDAVATMNVTGVGETGLTKAQIGKGIVLTVSFVLLRLVGARLWDLWFGLKYQFSLPFMVFLFSVFLVMSVGIILVGLGRWVGVDLKGWWFKRGQIMADIGWGLGALLVTGVLGFVGAIVATAYGLVPSRMLAGQDRGALAELPAQLVLGWFFGFAIASFGEESLFRGFWQEAARNKFGAWEANVLQAAMFSAAHLGLESLEKGLPLLLLRFGFGLLFGWLRMKRGTLLAAGIVHGFIG